jgi:uncharacterized membrane protein
LILFFAFGEKEKKYSVCFFTSLLFSGALLAALSMAASPVFPDRASFGLNTFIITAIGVFYAHMDVKHRVIKWLGRIAILYALPYFISDYHSGYKDLSQANRIMQERIAMVEAGKKEGRMDFVFKGEKIKSHTRFLHYWEFTDNPDVPPNNWFERYYGIHSVKCVEK